MGMDTDMAEDKVVDKVEGKAVDMIDNIQGRYSNYYFFHLTKKEL
jgi:hypothetical protein